MLEVQKYLQSGKSLQLLQTEYGIDYSIDNGVVSLNYNMINSPMGQEISKECRGLILRLNTWEVLAYPFYKFFNIGEGFQASIDWKSAKYLEKIDGTLIIAWYDEDQSKWQFATRSVPYGNKSVNGIKETFSQLTIQAIERYFNDDEKCLAFYDNLNKRYTYMFELTSPFNQIVVQHADLKFTLIGVRDLDTLLELDIAPIGKQLNIPIPTMFSFDSIDEAIILINKWAPIEHEGMVVVDKYFNRVKVKSAAYCFAHTTVSNLLSSNRNVMRIIMLNKDDDVLPLLTGLMRERFLEIKDKYINLCKIIMKEYNEIKDIKSDKEFALLATKTTWCTPLFSFRRKNHDTLVDFMIKMAEKQTSVDKVLQLIGM